MRLAWCTDIHLNFLENDEIARFCHGISELHPDALLITGDISEAPGVEAHLLLLAELLRLPIYFVLGNHDYYRGSIVSVREKMRALSVREAGLHWLAATGVVPLGEDTALVGHDGWADGRFGDFAHSRVMLNDYLHIDELAYLPRTERLAKLNGLGDEAAAHLREILPAALQRCAHVLVATHVPPFREACWHEGKVSEDDWLPHFSCRAVGEVLLEAMRERPDRTMTVVCGHTHGRGTAELLPNLVVHTGAAEYGAPRVERVLDLG